MQRLDSAAAKIAFKEAEYYLMLISNFCRIEHRNEELEAKYLSGEYLLQLHKKRELDFNSGFSAPK
jgi:hypothetical protein